MVTETGVLKRGVTVVSVRGGMIAITMTGMGRVDLVPMTKGEVTGGVMEITVGAGVFDSHFGPNICTTMAHAYHVEDKSVCGPIMEGLGSSLAHNGGF